MGDLVRFPSAWSDRGNAHRGVRIEREIKLIFPAEIEACPGYGVVAIARARIAPLARSAACAAILLGDHTDLHIIPVGQTQVFPSESRKTQHGRTETSRSSRRPIAEVMWS